MARQTFTDWMADVDVQVRTLTGGRFLGVSVDELPDYCYHDDYNDDMTPRQTAKAAIRNAREG